MSRTRAVPSVLVPLISLLVALVLAPSSADAREAAQLAGPGYHEPAVGLCYDLSAKQAGKPSSTAAAVPCDAPHTLVTVKVKRLPKDFRWKSLSSEDFYVPCQKALVDALGGSTKLVAMSAYDLWWFGPTQEERAKGAKWIRCDVGIHKGRTGLNKLPAVLGLTSFPLSNLDSRCLVGRGLATTSCEQGHDYRVKGAYQLDRLPKTAEQYRAAAQRCAQVAGTRRWAYSGPSALDLKAGDHWMVCFKSD